jgi:hypothetical protein
MGSLAGYSNTTGNVFIGYKAGYNETGSNKLYIANSDTIAPLIAGDFLTGRVGIGCSDPQYALHVIGDIAASGDIIGVGIITSGAVTACSDLRYKKNIVPIKNSLSNILKMQGVNYNWKIEEFPKKQFTNTLQIGFIAQDIEKIVPEVVTTDSDGYKGIDYSRLSPILVEAIKEQQAMIKEIQLKIAELESKVFKTK